MAWVCWDLDDSVVVYVLDGWKHGPSDVLIYSISSYIQYIVLIYGCLADALYFVGPYSIHILSDLNATAALNIVLTNIGL